MNTHFPNMAGGNSPLPKPVFKHMHRLRKPGDPITRQRFEFVDLGKTVRSWLTYLIGASTRDSAPRMMWIEGRPGEGKTEGTLVAALNANFHVLPLTGGDFAGDVEGASVKALHEILQECVAYSAMHGARIVVSLDDWDLSTANPGDAAFTINSNLLIQEMMALADERHRYRNADGSNIGFIVTVNDASSMRESLTRAGRAHWYTHCPTAEDRANIAWAILSPVTTAERDLVAALVRKNNWQPIAFWKALYHRMQALQARDLIERGMPNATAIDEAYSRRLKLEPAIAWQAAQELRKTRASNWLAKRSIWNRT